MLRRVTTLVELLVLDSADAHRFTISCALQISLDTRDVFIECTATDLTKAKVVLNTIVCMFAEYCTKPFEVEPVEVVDAAGQSTGG